MSSEAVQNLLYSLEIMWKGMVGIFIVMIIIALIVTVLAKFDSISKPSKKDN